ncbi:MAG: ABC transporter ATP-binding protein [Alphaproteobacteria bacterium]|nr:ABC transporter ATP-binding protein [Alphaproteobacteria bacterium]
MLEVSVETKSFASDKNCSKSILSSIHFYLKEGEVGAILGPSGYGKTTLMRIIAGLDKDFIGNVTYPKSWRLGAVFQEPRLLPWRSISDNLKISTPHDQQEYCAKLLDIFGLNKHLDLFPGQLSLGLARRVALVRALAIKPDILLLDEPFVSLDEQLAQELRIELSRVIDASNITTLLVTHDIDEAIALSDRLYLFSKTIPASIHEVIDNPMARHALAPEAARELKEKILTALSKEQTKQAN